MQAGEDQLSVVMTEMESIEVSAEMTAFFGRGVIGQALLPSDPVSLTYRLGAEGELPTLKLISVPDLDALQDESSDDWRIIFLVARPTVLRLGGCDLLGLDGTTVYIPAELRAIAAVLRDFSTTAETRSTYRLAKSIELFCETLRVQREGQLVPAPVGGVLSFTDVRRVVTARKLIDERWSEKLTLDAIARACGLNRAKLTRGFREVFDCTVAEALADRRLAQAERLLLTTDLPISSVGYEAGYLSNASFARAFGRRFGRSPSDYRARGVAA
jgi:AraC family transcriptional activator of pyochelin receptor